MEETISKAAELNRQGELLLQTGKADEAVAYFRQAEAEDPNEIATYLNLGRAAIHTGAFGEARKALGRALLLDGGCAEAHFHLSSVCFLEGKFKDGILEADQALAAGFDEPQLLRNMAAAYEELGEGERALRYYNRAIEKAPLDGSLYVNKTDCLIQLGRTEDALQTLRSLHVNCPDAFEYFHGSFVILMRAGKLEEAQAILRDGIQQFPGDAELYFDQVRLYNVLRQWESALKLLDALEEARDKLKLDERVLALERGKALMAGEKLPEAAEQLEKAAAMPGAPDFEAHYLLMNCDLALGRFEALRKTAETVEAADDGSEFARAARYYHALSLKREGRDAGEAYRSAIRYYRKLGLDRPQAVDVYLFRALCCRDLGENQEALRVLDYLDKLVPDYAPACLLRGAVLEAMGDAAGAAAANAKAGRLKENLDALRKDGEAK